MALKIQLHVVRGHRSNTEELLVVADGRHVGLCIFNTFPIYWQKKQKKKTFPLLQKVLCSRNPVHPSKVWHWTTGAGEKNVFRGLCVSSKQRCCGSVPDHVSADSLIRKNNYPVGEPQTRDVEICRSVVIDGKFYMKQFYIIYSFIACRVYE